MYKFETIKNGELGGTDKYVLQSERQRIHNTDLLQKGPMGILNKTVYKNALYSKSHMSDNALT